MFQCILNIGNYLVKLLGTTQRGAERSLAQNIASLSRARRHKEAIQLGEKAIRPLSKLN